MLLTQLKILNQISLELRVDMELPSQGKVLLSVGGSSKYSVEHTLLASKN